MKAILVHTTKKREIVDITDLINLELKADDFDIGLCNLFVLHTTSAITTADLDPGTDLDMLDAFEAFIPDLKYRHPHDPSHVADHILSTLIGTSLVVPVRNGELVLGDWQRVVLIELNGSRERKIILTYMPSASELRSF
ncbi:MAG: secondary thiamine-phosphate synthase enzyme YjbQ [bacterium]|nr:secondary thiamine-phosphate synthase enzyme YjbQ [bacterium]